MSNTHFGIWLAIIAHKRQLITLLQIIQHGGGSFTWSCGQGQETKKASWDDGSVRVENIDNLMGLLMGVTPGEFNIPEGLIGDQTAMILLNIFYESLNKSCESVEKIHDIVEDTKKLIELIKKYKNANTVYECPHHCIYDHQGNFINNTGKIPEGKEKAVDNYDCSKHEPCN